MPSEGVVHYIRFLQERLAEEVVRLRELAAVEAKNIGQLRLDVEALQAKLRVADSSFRRIRALHEKGYATDARFEDTEKEAITLRSSLKRKRLELSTMAAIASRSAGKRYITDDRAIGDVVQLKAQIQLARTEIDFARKKLAALIKHRAQLAVRAPFDGVLVKLPRASRATVKRGDVIAVVEQHQRRRVIAFLNQDEIMHVGLGDLAPIYVPALDQTLYGRVTAIDRTSGFIDEQIRTPIGHNRARRNAIRSARVTLEFEKPETIYGGAQFRSGLPVIVIFKQRSSSQVYSAFKKRSAALFGRDTSLVDAQIARTKGGNKAAARRMTPPASTQQVGKPVKPMHRPATGERGT
jgi:hypothetical protein